MLVMGSLDMATKTLSGFAVELVMNFNYRKNALFRAHDVKISLEASNNKATGVCLMNTALDQKNPTVV
jgi:hypothetical protein